MTLRISAVPMNLFALLGRQHAAHGRLDLIHRVIDDVVVAQVHTALLSASLRAPAVGTRVEADNHGLRSDRQVDVGLADAADRRVHDLHTHFVGAELEQRGGQGFLRTLHIGLDDERQGLGFALAQVLEHVLELGGLLLGQLDIAVLASAEGGDFTGAAFVAQHHELVAGTRHIRQTLDLDRNRRTGLGRRPCRLRPAWRARGRRSNRPAPRRRA